MANTPSTNNSGSQANVPPSNPGALIAAQAAEIQNLKDMLNELQAAIQVASQSNSIRVPTPKKFDGKRGVLKSYLASLDLFFRFNQGAYRTDQEKIMAAGMFMEGDAIVWFEPLLSDYLGNESNRAECSDETKETFKDYGTFKEKLELIFGEIDEGRTAERRIQELKQTKSAAQYSAEFKKHQSKIDWDDAPLIATYYNGLKERVKDEIARQDRPEDLTDMMKLAIRIDNRQFEREMEKRGQKFATPNTKKKIQAREYHYDPMDIDRIEAKNKKPAKKWMNKGWTKDQKQKLKETGACLGCGEMGHFVRECPRKKKYPTDEKPRWEGPRVAVVQWKLDDEIITGQPDSESDYEVVEKANLKEDPKEKITRRRSSTPIPRQGDRGEPHYDEDSWDERKLDLRPRLPSRRVPAPGLQPLATNNSYARTSEIAIPDELVKERLNAGHCWICNSYTHIAGECDQRYRTIAVNGPNKEEVYLAALEGQPFFLEAPVGENTQDWYNQQHQRKHWIDCHTPGCKFHKGKKKTTGFRNRDPYHYMLKPSECQVIGCPTHNYQLENSLTEEAKEESADNEAQEESSEEDFQDADQQEEDTKHGSLHWTACYDDNCSVHRSDKDAGYYPSRKNIGDKSHKQLHWSECTKKDCMYHRAKEELGLPRRKRALGNRKN